MPGLIMGYALHLPEHSASELYLKLLGLHSPTNIKTAGAKTYGTLSFLPGDPLLPLR